LDKRSPSAEAYRHLRTSILLSQLAAAANAPDYFERAVGGQDHDSGQHRTQPGSDGRKSMIIDADMRRPRLHDIFGLRNGNGLSSLLRGRVGRPKSWQYYKDEESGLHIFDGWTGTT